MNIKWLKNFRNNYPKNEAKMLVYHYICSIRENLVRLFTCEDEETKFTYAKSIDNLAWKIRCVGIKSFSGKLKRKEYYDLFMFDLDDEYSNFKLNFQFICHDLGIDFTICESIPDKKMDECRDIYYSLADAISVAEAWDTDYNKVDKVIERLYEA